MQAEHRDLPLVQSAHQPLNSTTRSKASNPKMERRRTWEDVDEDSGDKKEISRIVLLSGFSLGIRVLTGFV